MNKVNLLKSLFIVAISLFFVHCTSEDPIAGPEGPAGPAGANGQDGGYVCLNCHNADYKVVQPETYAMSGHGTGTAHVTHGSTSCGACHTDEGYRQSIGSQTLTLTAAVAEARIGCSTCHSGGHASAGVALGGKDAALRHSGAYTLNQLNEAGQTVSVDYANNSNNCTHCHQPRRTATSGLAPATTGTNAGKITINSTLGPHYGNQSALLEGMFGAEIAGTTPYPAKGSATHRTGASCTSCHMGAKIGTDGNHTMSPSVQNCKTCHATAASYDVNGGQNKIKLLMLELAEEIIRVKAADFRIANYTGTKPFTSPNVFTDPTYSTNQLTVIATRYYDPADAVNMKVAKAYWNWRYVYQDHSYGVHNPKYAEALLKNTIADLKTIP